MRTIFAPIVGSAAAPDTGEAAAHIDSTSSESRIANLEAQVARLEAALLDREAELDALLNVIPVGIGVAFDPLCKRIRTNSTLAGYLDLDAAENSSKTADAAERPTHFACVDLDGRMIADEQLPMQISAHDGTEIRDREFNIIHEDGRIVRLLGYSAPLSDPAGNLRGSVGAFIDVTERRRSEENERQRLAEIAHANRLCTLGGMISGLAHELNQPLAAANNYARSCQRWPSTTGRDLPPEVLDLLQSVSRQTERASEIVKRLTTFVKKSVAAPASIDVNEVVAGVITLTKSCFGPAMGRAAAISIVPEFSSSLPMIAADSIQIEQVLVNLIRNALESTIESDASQPVIVRTSRREGFVRVDVVDSGAGVAAEDFPSLFQPFFTTKNEGLGLGLSISRSIIENHGGQLWAERNPVKGATFSFELPIAAISCSPELRR